MAAAAQSTPSWQDNFTRDLGIYLGSVGLAVQEIARLFPDSVLFGSLVLYVITQHLPYGVFAVFLLESSVFYKLVNLVMDSVVGRPVLKQADLKERKNCRPGFLQPRLEPERIFMNEGIVSMPMFYMASTVAYLLGANFQYAQVLRTMGANWGSRVIFSAICAALLLILFYIRAIPCSTHLSLIGAILLGALAGIGFWYLNSALFGKESMNFAGLPYLTDKTENGQPLYTCVPNLSGA